MLARLSLYYFAYFSFIGVFMPYFALYLDHRGLSGGEIGMVMALMQVMRLLAPNLWGWLADRSGQSLMVLRLAALISSLGFAALVAGNGLFAIAACVTVMSFFWTAQSPLAEALTLDLLRERQGGYGRVRGWRSAGFVCAVLLMGFWLEQASLEHIYHGGLLCLLAIFACAWLLPSPRLSVCSNATPPAPLREILLRPEVWKLLLACLLMTGAHGAFNVFYSMHLVDAGHSKTVIGALWTLGVLAEIAMFQWAPSLMRRYSVTGMLRFALCVAVIRFALIGWTADSLVLLLLAQLAHGITFGLTHIVAVSAISQYFGEGQASRGQAVYGSVAYGAGGILGSLVSGWVWQAAGGAWAFTACAVLAGVGVLAVVTKPGRPQWWRSSSSETASNSR
ncbi:MAG: MFS transporter [Candidatus Dactylopiibacterium carminicum]|nr:MAG: MFS transporter [Candidatus Dactylopiibacterium carminicum]